MIATVYHSLREFRWVKRKVVGSVLLLAMSLYVITRSRYIDAVLTNNSSVVVPDRTLPLENSSPQMVLLLAYMHTGSSYLGGLFQQHPHTFYMFEPLRGLKQKMKYKRFIKYINGTEAHNLSEEDYKQLGAQSVVDMFSCNHQNLDIATLTERYNVGIRGSNLEDYFRCVQEHCYGPHESGDSSIYTYRGVCGHTGVTYVQQAQKAINKCLWKRIIQCKDSKLRAFKMIRMSMDMAELALQTFPNMRIIHLFRDPRAMINSNDRKGELGGSMGSRRERSEFICGQMANDFRTAEKMKDIYPGRIFTLRYEDMVEDPMGVAKTVYDFAKVPFTNLDESYVRSKCLDAYKNSTVMASVWRNHITQGQLNIVENMCVDVFQMLGYEKLENITNVRNLNVIDYKRNINVS